MKKKNIIAAYAVYSELKNITKEDALSLDVINIAFCHCVNAEISFKHESELSHIKRIKELNPEIKILFSVGGWGSGGFSPMAASAEGRRRFAESCLEFVKKHSLDGIDIDWEYPGIDWAGIEASSDDKVNFTLVLKEIRRAFDHSNIPNLMLTIAVGNDQYFIDNTEMDKVSNYLDYVSIMTYDMRGCGDRITGHHTNIYSYDAPPSPRGKNNGLRSVEHSVEIFSKAGVPISKIVIGAAFYSRMWKNVQRSDNSTNGLGSFADPGNYGPGFGELDACYIGKNGFLSFYDEKAEGAYLFDGLTFISYDNERSLKQKCAFVKQMGLLGIMYWEHSCDGTGKLLAALKEGMS